MLSTTDTDSPRTQRATNLDWALKYASMGLRVFPLIPGSKAPATSNGVKDATTDIDTITRWWTDMPDAGVGLAAEAVSGGPCFLEFDQRPWLAQWAKEAGEPKPQTRLHKSGGKESPHYVFTHTPKSLELGNCDGAKDGHEWFSFRAVNRYIVAPPSIHPDSGKPYTVELDVEPIPIPDWLVAKIAKEGVSEHQFSEGLRQCSEDFDADKFFAWLEECGCSLGIEDGAWIPFEECPVVGRRHKGQGVRGCALFWDGGGLGFKCHAQECPSNTDRKTQTDDLGAVLKQQSGIGYLVSFLSREHKPYDGVIWDEIENFEAVIDDPDPVDLDEPEKISEPEPSGTFCKTKGCGNWQPGATLLCKHCEKNKGRTCPQCGKELPLTQATSGVCMACMDAIIAEADKPKATTSDGTGAPQANQPEKPTKEQKLHELWDFPEEAKYGWLGEIAASLNAPMSLAYPTMLCAFAGQGVPKSGSVRGNLYGCLIGPKGTGKTRTIDRGLSKLEYEYPRQIKKRYPGSEHGLMLTLDGKKPKDMEDLDWKLTKPFLLVQDEYRSTFGKMSIDNSALPYMINHLFNQSDYETASQKGSMVCIAQLSMIGGLTAENAEEFGEVFGKATTTGTYDRFLYGIAPPKWDWDDEWEKDAVPTRRLPKAVSIPSEIYAAKKAWQAEDPEVRRRLGELALRIALVTASANGDHSVSLGCLRAALKFCEWQQAIRAWYRPSEMDDKDGICQEAICRVLERLGKEDPDGWVSWKKAKRAGNLSRHTAPRVIRIYKGMVELGMIEEERETDGNGKDSKKKTGMVRLKT
jgi:hypothetical protein